MNSKSNSWDRYAILVGAIVMLLIQLLGAIGIAALLYSGRIPESATGIASGVIRMTATIVAAIVTWLLSKGDPIQEMFVAVSISMAIALIMAMLFWQIDLRGFLTGFGIAIATVVLFGCALHRTQKGKSSKFKNSSMVKMYKNIGR